MQLALGRVALVNPVNHKLRVLVRVDVDPGHVTLEVTGCLAQGPDSPSLLHIMRRAGRLGAGTGVTIDLHGSSHLDPEVLLQLRSIAAASVAAAVPDSGAAGAEPFRVTLAEPAELPICLLHVGSDGAVLAGLDGQLPAVPPLDVSSDGPADDFLGRLRRTSRQGRLGETGRRRRPAPRRARLRRQLQASPNSSKVPLTRPPPSGRCPTPHCASWPTPCTGTSTPAARPLARTPGTSWRPRSCRTAS